MRIPASDTRICLVTSLQKRVGDCACWWCVGVAVTDTTHPRDLDGLRDAVLDAAVLELAGRKVAHFSLEGVARRAGVPVRTVRDLWPNTPDLLAATLRAYGERTLPIPDTGSLRGDLLEYSRSYAAAVNTPEGRRVLDALMIHPTDWEMPGPRSTWLEARMSRVGVMIARAIERGECTPDIDAARIIDHLGLGLCLPVLWYDRSITDEDCLYVVDMILYGITPRN